MESKHTKSGKGMQIRMILEKDRRQSQKSEVRKRGVYAFGMQIGKKR
jgi:hypothetical protein